MTRKILLIANPGSEHDPEHYCQGVNVDVQAYKDFFLSPVGGNWYDSEIQILDRPSRSTVELALLRLSLVDYSMVIFCGHGYSNKDGETILELRKGEELPESKIRSSSLKSTIILDCCREKWEPIPEPILETRIVDFSQSKQLLPSEARSLYDLQISKANNGIVVMYACDLNEVAGDDSRKGGYYSYSLRRVATELSWEYHSHPEVLSVADAHSRAAGRVCSLTNGTQNPQIEKPRTYGPMFPFAVAR